MKALLIAGASALALSACATQAQTAEAPAAVAAVAAPSEAGTVEKHVSIVRVRDGEWTPAPGAPGAPPAPPAPPKVKIDGDAVFFEGREIAKLDDQGQADAAFTTEDGRQGRVKIERTQAGDQVNENVKLFIADNGEALDLAGAEAAGDKVMIFAGPDGRTIEVRDGAVFVDGKPMEGDADMTWVEGDEAGETKVIVIKQKSVEVHAPKAE